MRIVFHEPDCADEVRGRLVAMNCVTERARQYNLMAVSIPFSVALEDVQAYLQSEEQAGRLGYEEPILRHG